MNALTAVLGLRYHEDFISPSEEEELLAAVELEEWSYQWQRRTQFYGVQYLPGDARGVKRPLPAWSDPFRRRLFEEGVTPSVPNQLGVNEYLPGQGIAGHVDFLGGSVVSLSLGSGCVMEFTRDDLPYAPWVYLPRRSIVVLTGEARHDWKHGIPRRKSDVVNGKSLPRSRRVSITFRDLELPG
jgi:alkylated DNA repair dioxygenase AlkB